MAKFDKKEWLEKQDTDKSALIQSVNAVVDGWEENPETIAELAAFASRFYRYSPNNIAAILSQNDGATFVASFPAWKEHGYKVNKGEKGIKIFVPTPVTLFDRDGMEMQVRFATPEEKEKIKNGEIKTWEKMHFKLGTVFDIAQTNCPVEDYPKFYSMGYADVSKAALIEQLKQYSETAFNCPVYETNLQSIGLRGAYFPEENAIRLNEKLEDSERLSTLIHELGHATLHNMDSGDRTPPMLQRELEADMYALMLQSRLEIPIEDGRKRHLADHYRAYNEAAEKAEVNVELTGKPNLYEDFTKVVNKVVKKFGESWPQIEPHIERENIVEKKTWAIYVPGEHVKDFEGSIDEVNLEIARLGKERFEESKKKFGSVVYQGKEYALLQDAYYDHDASYSGYEWYEAQAIDIDGNIENVVRWEVTDPEAETAEFACDWDNPEDVTEGDWYIRAWESETPQISQERSEPEADKVTASLPNNRKQVSKEQKWAEERKTLVVNCYAGPGAGKTTASWAIAAELKKQGYNVEYVPEYAKELVWEGRNEVLDGSIENQKIITAEQNKRIDRLIGKVPIVITDSPLLLRMIYCNENEPQTEVEAFGKEILKKYESYNNFNLYIERKDNYEPAGRLQTREESIEIDNKVEAMLKQHGVFYGKYALNKIDSIVSNIKKTLQNLETKNEERNQQKETAPTKNSTSQLTKKEAVAEERARKVEAAKSVPILNVVEGCGYTLTKKGNSYSTKEHDSISITPEKNMYIRHSTKEGGTPIDFLMKMQGMSYKDAVDRLANMAGHITNLSENTTQRAERAQAEKGSFILPPKADNNKRVFAYLCSRGIHPKTINAFFKRGLLYESADKHNCVFLGKDENGTIHAGYLRGTYTKGETQFKGNVTNSNKEYGVVYEGAADTKCVCCFEAPIDMMSFMQLRDTESHKIALGGVDDTALAKFLETHTAVGKICFCFDNDKENKQGERPGVDAAEALSKKYAEKGYETHTVFPPAGKDWNDWLKIHAEMKTAKEQEKPLEVDTMVR